MNTSITDAELARKVAQEAGQLLLGLRASFISDRGPISDRDLANELRDAADAASNDLILTRLHAARPSDSILSEEAKDDSKRLEASRVWVVDPLDGTWEYGQDRVDFAVHIALWCDGVVQAACVDLPAQKLCRSDLDTPDFPPLPVDRPVRVVASRSRPPASLEETCSHLGRILKTEGVNGHGVEIVDVGSVGAKVNEILCGRAEVYLHDTGFYEWDVAAPYGVALHYGLKASHLDGRPVTFNHMPPYVTDFKVCHPDIAVHLDRALAQASKS